MRTTLRRLNVDLKHSVETTSSRFSKSDGSKSNNRLARGASDSSKGRDGDHSFKGPASRRWQNQNNQPQHQQRQQQTNSHKGQQTPKDRQIFHLNPTAIARASPQIFASPLFSVQWCPTVLLLRSWPILLNPFHPLLRAALRSHEKSHQIGYLLHLHSSSKLLTGRQSSVRHTIRGKVRSAWEQVLRDKGYDIETGRFVAHLRPDYNPAEQRRLQDIRGTVSIVPKEACLNAKYLDIVADCERGLSAVMGCKHRNDFMEKIMNPANLWRYYDWRRRLMLKKYVDRGAGLSINGTSVEKFREFLDGVRKGDGQQPAEGGGEYLVDVDGEKIDIGPLKREKPAPGFKFGGDVDVLGGRVEEADDLDDSSLANLYGDTWTGSNESGLRSMDMDWGMDEEIGESEETRRGPSQKTRTKTKTNLEEVTKSSSMSRPKPRPLRSEAKGPQYDDDF